MKIKVIGVVKKRGKGDNKLERGGKLALVSLYSSVFFSFIYG